MNELIAEEDRKRIEALSIDYPSRGLPNSLYKWTVDRDSGTFLLWTGGTGPESYNTEYFILYWDNRIVKIKTRRNEDGELRDGLVCLWELLELRIPSEIEVDRSIILEVLKDALRVFGVYFHPEAVREAHFNF
ncbi:MAG: hypothetical protein HQL66_04690 [Magnetococcales bacterium]|nr:hypothetical protein [Magnetococcales bacterium]